MKNKSLSTPSLGVYLRKPRVQRKELLPSIPFKVNDGVYKINRWQGREGRCAEKEERIPPPNGTWKLLPILLRRDDDLGVGSAGFCDVTL